MERSLRRVRHIDLPESFRFPVGLEYVSRISVMAWGEVRYRNNGGEAHNGGEALLPRRNEDETSLSRRDKSVASPIASLPRRISIEPNVSSVTRGLTPSNTYLVAWHNACVERSATNRVNAAIELFPDGSITTIWQPLNPNQQPTTNHQQPVPPPGFHGHGQDADWIHGNFELLHSFGTEFLTAEDIIGMGYDNWLMNDAVCINEENGHYRCSVTILDLPADGSPCYLVCGPHKVTVTQIGTYRFPLEVLETYEIRTYPEALPLILDYDDGYRGEGVSYEIFDDADDLVAATPPLLLHH